MLTVADNHSVEIEDVTVVAVKTVFCLQKGPNLKTWTILYMPRDCWFAALSAGAAKRSDWSREPLH